jgi:hypothetical protein
MVDWIVRRSDPRMVDRGKFLRSGEAATVRATLREPALWMGASHAASGCRR